MLRWIEYIINNLEHILLLIKEKLTQTLDEYWRYFVYDDLITKEDAIEMQHKAGFHPAGYDFINWNQENGKTFWQALRSCS